MPRARGAAVCVSEQLRMHRLDEQGGVLAGLLLLRLPHHTVREHQPAVHHRRRLLH